MKRNYTPFVTGMVTMALLIGLISASFAANEKNGQAASGGAVPADIGIGMFLHQQIAPGEMLTTENGGKAPKVLACEDTKGETHYYIEATAVAELFDVADGVNFHEEANQLEFGIKPWAGAGTEGFEDFDAWDVLHSRERHDFMLGGTVNTKTGERILDGGGVPTTTSNGYVFSHSQGLDDEDPELRAERWARYKSLCKEKPVYGETLGMYTEVDPSEVNLATLSGVAMKDKLFTDETEVRQNFCFTSIIGKYAAITIENTGTSEVKIDISRFYTVGGPQAGLPSVYIPAGGKMMRVFRIDENKPLENQLQLKAQPLGPGGVSIKLTEEQYRSGN